MGVLSLKPNENVFFPAPFQEDEVYPVVVTSQRVIMVSPKHGQSQLEIGKVTYLGKASKRPFLFPGVALALVGLPGLIFAIYLWVSVMGLKGYEEGEEAPVNEAGETVENPDHTRIKAIAVAVLGLIFIAGGALLVRKQKHFVVAQAQKATYKLPVADKTAQTQVLMTIQAALTSQKAMAKAAAAAQPPPPAAKKS